MERKERMEPAYPQFSFLRRLNSMPTKRGDMLQYPLAPYYFTVEAVKYVASEEEDRFQHE